MIVVVDSIDVTLAVSGDIKRQAKLSTAGAGTPPLALIDQVTGRTCLIQQIALLQRRKVIPTKRDTAGAGLGCRRFF